MGRCHAVATRPPCEVVPKRGNQGAKDFEPSKDAAVTAAQQAKLDASRKEWVALASAPRVMSTRGQSVGVLREDIERVELVIQKGSHFKSVGYFDKAEQKTMLYPEEALLLMDKVGGVTMVARHACVRACVRACARACVRACVRVPGGGEGGEGGEGGTGLRVHARLCGSRGSSARSEPRVAPLTCTRLVACVVAAPRGQTRRA